MRIIIAITGASGINLGKRLLEELKEHETHLIITPDAEKVAGFENVNLQETKSNAKSCHKNNDFTSPIASSSFLVDAMIIIPCSMKTLSGIANGYTDSLVTRSADNMLKMNKPLILVPRETPLSLPAIENMAKAKRAGAIILPAMLSYYNQPETVADITDFIVGKTLDVLGVENKLYKRWSGK
ncbi:MAG TPA: UbiX family flavin prenyltransferase [Candidatus Altiarchaeales archaeon]|nr:UbiX family flavin prenyltransferase [Candidatus Altiarchaeales archaeon]